MIILALYIFALLCRVTANWPMLSVLHVRLLKKVILSLRPLCTSNHSILLHGFSWWRHQMETFSALLALCAGNSPVNGEFPSQRPVTRSFDVFFDLRLKRLSKQSRRLWFETPSHLSWRHCYLVLLSFDSKTIQRQSHLHGPTHLIPINRNKYRLLNFVDLFAIRCRK